MTEKFADAIEAKQLFQILEGISDAVFADDSTGRCLWCNKACEELYNISLDDVYGKYVDELEDMGVFSPSVTKRVLKEQREMTIIHKNKYGKKLLTTGTPIFDSDNNVSMVITTSRDITRLTKHHHAAAAVPIMNMDTMENIDLPNDGIIANSLAMKNVMSLTKKLAAVDSTVLITGESGVGKGLIAKFLHGESSRYEKPFVTVNCGAIPENLIESELFGYVPGAFTGSKAEGKRGLFEAAQNGTIFLDEISELPLNLQVKLLRVIQDREITPVGGVKTIPIDVRIISATNKSLSDLVKEGKFREDLYYRLNVVPINIPPLRDRPDDILPLIQSNLMRCNKKLGEDKRLSSEALTILLQYPWPGNIRELQNIVERITITTNECVISEESLPAFLMQEAKVNANTNVNLSLSSAMEKAEKEILEKVYANYKSTRAMAKVLQVSQPTIVRKLHKYNIIEDSQKTQNGQSNQSSQNS